MKVQWTFIAGLIFAILIAIFAIANVDKVAVNYLFGTAQWPLILIILGSAFFGAIGSASFAMMKIYSGRRKHSQLEQALQERETLVGMQQEKIQHLQSEVARLEKGKPTQIEVIKE
ncbi:LapA family protein [Metalysinibacillus jejuensis]|uniref:LapA family protein n=1 Tax=Metalysinibacillus jejuensis TaxID=914327 RepID=UPI000D3841B4|nr:LapA family protein [Metalysinibacillus jejuensis]